MGFKLVQDGPDPFDRLDKFKAIHVSDTHFGLETYGHENPDTGLNTRAEDGFQAFDQMIDYAIENKVKLIIHSGDVFNTKTVSQTVVNRFYQAIKRATDAGILVDILQGNHDASRFLQRKTGLDLASTLEAENMRITRGGDYTDYGFCQIVTVPYWSTPEAIVDDINRLAEKVDWTRPAFLVGHLQIDYVGFPGKFKDDLPFVPSSALGIHPWTYVAIGHIHKNYKLLPDKHAYYAGSLVRCTFTEEHDPKGFMTFDVDGTEAKNVKLHEVDCLKLRTIRGSMSDVKAQLDKTTPKDWKNYIVRLVVDETEEPADEGYLKSKLSQTFKYVLQKERKRDTMNRVNAAGLTSMNDFLNTYFKDEPDKNELLAMVEEIKASEEGKVA